MLYTVCMQCKNRLSQNNSISVPPGFRDVFRGACKRLHKILKSCTDWYMDNMFALTSTLKKAFLYFFNVLMVKK